MTIGRISRNLLAGVAFLLLAPCLCPDQVSAATGTAQYIVVIKRDASVLPDATKLGGRVDLQANKRLVVTLPDSVVEAWRRHPSVKYLQLVVTGTGPRPNRTGALTSESASRMDPVPNASPPTWDSGSYSYDGTGNVKQIGPDSEQKTSSFRYDLQNRLVQSDIGGRVETYSYDEFGNITTITQGTTTALNPDRTTNHLPAAIATYDASGNVIAQVNRTYRYDALGMLQAKNWDSIQETYIYSPSDERIGIRSSANGTWQKTLWTLRDEQGKELREFEQTGSEGGDAPWTWFGDHVYNTSGLLGTQNQPEEGGEAHLHLDHLGSPRLITNAAGQAVSLHDYAPFGGELTPPCQEQARGYDHDEPMHFTGLRRDIESADCTSSVSYLDYMHARNYEAVVGRFLTIDPGRDWDLHQPQSWNMYSYARNNPLRNVDDDGQKVIDYLVKMASGAYRSVTRDIAVRFARTGEKHAVKVVGPGASREAKGIVKEAFSGEKLLRHDPHPGPGERLPHWQPEGASNGQVGYEIGVFVAGLIPVLGWAADADAAEVSDANPAIERRAQELYGHSFWTLSSEERKKVLDSFRQPEPPKKEDPKKKPDDPKNPEQE